MPIKLLRSDSDGSVASLAPAAYRNERSSIDAIKLSACLNRCRARARAAVARTPVNSVALIRALEHVERLSSVSKQRDIQLHAQQMLARAADALLNPATRNERLRRLSVELDRIDMSMLT